MSGIARRDRRQRAIFATYLVGQMAESGGAYDEAGEHSAGVGVGAL